MRTIVVKVLCIIILFSFVFLVYLHKQPNIKKEETVSKTNETLQDSVHYVSLTIDSQIYKIELETYLLGVIASEMPYTFEMEALKAQCVAARTFVVSRGYALDNTTNSQVYHSEVEMKEIYDEHYDEMLEKINQALIATKGEVMMYDGKYISALFYSSNNGYSNNSEDYYTSKIPYLRSVDSHWDKAFNENKNEVIFNENEVKERLSVNSLEIKEVTTYTNGYIKTIVIDNQLFTGREVREKLNLRSSCFSFSFENDGIHITCEGYGHGVGMSQYGAQGMAQEGYHYDEILKRYYCGITIEKIKSE